MIVTSEEWLGAIDQGRVLGGMARLIAGCVAYLVPLALTRSAGLRFGGCGVRTAACPWACVEFDQQDHDGGSFVRDWSRPTGSTGGGLWPRFRSLCNNSQDDFGQ